MSVIHKYEVTIGAAAQIVCHSGAEFVHFAEQHGRLYVWLEFDPMQPEANIGYRIFGTGEDISPPVDLAVQHRFSCLTQGGSFVWHLYRIWHSDDG